MAMWRVFNVDGEYLSIPAGSTETAISIAKGHGLKAFAAIPFDVNIAKRVPNFRLPESTGLEQ